KTAWNEPKALSNQAAVSGASIPDKLDAKLTNPDAVPPKRPPASVVVAQSTGNVKSCAPLASARNAIAASGERTWMAAPYPIAPRRNPLTPTLRRPQTTLPVRRVMKSAITPPITQPTAPAANGSAANTPDFCKDSPCSRMKYVGSQVTKN